MFADKFFTQKHCDRCRNKLDARTMSWFTTDTICMDCSDKEVKIKNKMRESGINPNDYEGCGYVPTIKTA